MRASFNEFCKTFLADGLDHTAKYLQQATTFGFKSEKELKEAFNTFAKSYSMYFEPHAGDGSMPKCKYPRADSPTELFKKLASDRAMKNISGIYDSYLYYSKYDHFGVLYYDTYLTSLQEKLRMIDKSTRMFTRHCTILYDALDRVSQKDLLIEKEYKKVSEYMLKVTQNGV